MARRKPIPERTIKALFAKSRNMCAFEGCRRMIVDETTNTVMGEIAHIEGVGKRSARHNPNLPEERLNDIENLILLCHEHHVKVDDKHNGYTVSQLREMKQRHEKFGRLDIEAVDGRLARIYMDQAVIKKTTVTKRVYSHSIHNEASGNAHQTVNVFIHPKSDPIPDDAIQKNAEQRAYVFYLIDQYKKLAGAYSSNPKAVAINLNKAIRKQFGTKAVAVSSTRFEALCSFLKGRIDNTPVGKGNVRKGAPNYRAFPL